MALGAAVMTTARSNPLLQSLQLEIQVFHIVSCLSVDSPEHRDQRMTFTLPSLIRVSRAAILLLALVGHFVVILRLGSRSSFSRTACRTNCERTTPSFLIPRSISGISSLATETVNTQVLFFAMTPRGILRCIDSVRISVNKISLHKRI